MKSDLTCLDEVRWDAQGLVPVIAQEVESGIVLMLAWMNREALQQTITSGHAVYWSRSRACLWHKGETSGHFQIVENIRLDCDSDAILLEVRQVGGIACHTGRHHCFYKKLDHAQWTIVEPIRQDPATFYPSSN